MERINNFIKRNGIIAFLGLNIKRLIRKEHRRYLGEIARYVSKKLRKPLAAVYWDIFVKCLAARAIYSEYFEYYFYEKPISEARKFFTLGRTVRVLPALKSRSAEALFNNKPEFDKVFEKYIKREVLFLSPDTPFEAFTRFADRHTVFVAKPASANAGRGIWLVDSSNFPSHELMLETLRNAQTLLLEERVMNHHELDRFSGTSLNTLRLITLRLPEGVKLIAAFLKFSLSGKITDNLAQGGFACPIDMETGRIVNGMTNMTHEQEYSESHPDGFYLPGIRIPHWESAVAMAVEATLFLEDVYFVPWDIAITDNGPLIIEGNNVPSFNFQIMMNRPCNEDMQRAYKYAVRSGKIRS